MGAAQERPRRAKVLAALRDADAPLGVADVAGRVGVHVNTARFHLDALSAEGSVEGTLEAPSGPGRPRTVYAPRPGMDRGGKRSYLLLARILLSRLSSAPDAGEAAEEAGRAWGNFLVERPPPFKHPTAAQAVARLTGLLADLGFAPEPGKPEAAALEAGKPEAAENAAAVPEVTEVIRLRHCPFLELAEEHGQVVCRIHLGLMQGALTELRAPVAADALEPFAEPGACLAHLRPADAA